MFALPGYVAGMEHGANIGGWRSELSGIRRISREDAMRLGQERNQEATLSMGVGEFVTTGRTGG